MRLRSRGRNLRRACLATGLLLLGVTAVLFGEVPFVLAACAEIPAG